MNVEARVGPLEHPLGLILGAVGLETGDDPDPEIGLPRGGADACGVEK